MTDPGRDRATINRQFQAVDCAFKAGDMASLRRALDDPPGFPNVLAPHDLGIDTLLEYAIYWSPVSFIRELIALGADVDYEDASGFPALIAAISTERADKLEVLRVLLEAGANVAQRGINDWTPLHFAVSIRDLDSVRLLLAHGADPNARTHIDECSTPLEDAETIGFTQAAISMRDNIASTARQGTQQ